MSDIALRKTIRRCTALLVIVLSAIAIILASSSEIYSANVGFFVIIAYVLLLGSVLYLCGSALVGFFNDSFVEPVGIDEEREQTDEENEKNG